MNFNHTVRRLRIELVGLELISAVTRSGLVRNKSIIDLYLMSYADVPWTISGLSNAAQMDRAIIRNYINRGLETGEYELRESGYVLTDLGWKISMGRVLQCQRHMHPDVRKFLYRFFKSKGGNTPLRDFFMFALSLDRLARIVKLEFSYIAGLKTIEWEAGPKGVTIKDTATRTGFSYSVMHKQFSKMEKLGYITRVKGAYRITRSGKRHSFGIFISSWRSVTLKEWIIAVKLMTF